MADDLELWSDRAPVRRPPSSVAPRFGLSRSAELVQQRVAAAAETETETETEEEVAAPEPRRERGPFVTYLLLPWSYGDRSPGDAWHRMKCRAGRHVITGGHTMQVGGEAVFVERRCRWCGVEPG
jgi:hypothetical protein